MLDPINSQSKVALRYEPLKSSLLLEERYCSTLASSQESTIGNAFWMLVSPIVWILDWLGSKLTLTTEELEMFEKLLEGAFWGGAAFFYKREMGEARLREVVASCEELYAKLGKKWFPNVEGILFMRGNLIKIKMRAYAALGEEDKVKTSLQELKDIGIEVPNEVELQAQYLLAATQPKFRFVLGICNRLAQLGFKIVSKIAG